MKIDDALKKTAGLGVGAAQTRASKGADKATSNATTTDSVHISSQLQSLEGQVSSASVFDSAKVEQIKSAIADGRFQVNPEKVADGLISTVSSLLKSRKA